MSDPISVTRQAVNITVSGAQGPPGADSGGGVWGTITGTLADQTDLNSALGGKAATSHTHTSSQISDATAAATANMIVKRDADGSFSVGYITLTDTVTGFTGLVFATSDLTANRSYHLPDVSGARLAVTGSLTGVPDALTNGTISGTVAFGTGAATNMRNALGVGTTDAVTFGSTVFAGGGSVTGAAGSLTIAASGTNQSINLTPSGTGNVLFQNGSASRPSFGFASDAGTGFFAGAAAQVWFVAGSINIFRYLTNRIELTSGKHIAWTSDTSYSAQQTTLSQQSSGILQVGTSGASALGSLALTNLTASGTIKTGGHIYAQLPIPTTGMRCYITDGANSPVYMAAAAGGGTTYTPVFYNGSAWVNA